MYQEQERLIQVTLPGLEVVEAGLAIADALDELYPHDPAIGPWEPPPGYTFGVQPGTAVVAESVATELGEHLTGKGMHPELRSPSLQFASSLDPEERSRIRVSWFRKTTLKKGEDS